MVAARFGNLCCRKLEKQRRGEEAVTLKQLLDEYRNETEKGDKDNGQEGVE